MKNKKIYFVSLLTFAAMFVLGSCSSLVLRQSRVLNGADLYEYKTFSIIHPRTMSLPKGVKQSDIERLDDAIVQEMISRGYSEVNAQADMVVTVSYQVKLSKEVDVMTTGSRSGVRARGYISGSRVRNTSVSAETVRDGIVIMDIASRADNEPLFHSQLEVHLNSDVLFLKDKELLSKATDKLFKKFPIKKS